MKQTIDINLAGIKFTFDDDAFRMLDEYLSSLEEMFKQMNTDYSEILEDIERRLAEIIISEHDAVTTAFIVTKPEVVAMIEKVGEPEEIMEFCDMSGNVSGGKTGGEEASVKEEVRPVPPPIPHRLYRTPWDKELGGVCGGLAAYFGIDPTYIRLGWVLLTIFTATFSCVAYLILWVVIPEAKTPMQKLQLVGAVPTLSNISATVTGKIRDGKEYLDSELRKRNSAVSIFGNIIRILFIIISVLLVPVIITLIMAVFATAWLMINQHFALGQGPAAIFPSHPLIYGSMIITCALIAAAILIVPVYFAFSGLFGWKETSGGVKKGWFSVVVILAALCAMLSIVIRNINI